MIVWDGIVSDDIGLYVEHYPGIVLPTRKVSFVSIPGRSGDVLVRDDSFQNVTLTYDVYITETKNFLAKQREITQFLYKAGYRELSDSYDVGITRIAAFIGGQEFESNMNRAGRATIEFNARPQRYITANLETKPYTSAMTLWNPTGNEARPLIVVNGTGTGTLTVGNQTVSFSSLPVILDCEEQNAYYGGLNMNNTVTGEFPVLPAGETGFSWTGGVTGIEIAERWYYL